eukprot:TRINITY_DN6456_c0_g1_i12.p1 TRINITY_DN6456_c0_g1~~TRINITY_DN6456_c0_g1_i12.p1  ORF type:complete len:100 (-),score=28.25 TRINITY_DN6456_c0_g1_i12:963-1262(-)
MEERFNRQRKDVTGIEEARRLIKASNGISVDLSGLDLEQIPEELYQLNGTQSRVFLFHPLGSCRLIFSRVLSSPFFFPQFFPLCEVFFPFFFPLFGLGG